MMKIGKNYMKLLKFILNKQVEDHSKGFSTWELVSTNVKTSITLLELFRRQRVSIQEILNSSITWDYVSSKQKDIMIQLNTSRNVLSQILNIDTPITIWLMSTTFISCTEKLSIYAAVQNYTTLRIIIVIDIGHSHCLRKVRWGKQLKR